MEWALSGGIGFSEGYIRGLRIGKFTKTDATWHGIDSTGNGVEYLPGRSFCFNPGEVSHPWYRPTEEELTVVKPITPGTGGDPHFKTWQNEHYLYHGQCDLVLAKDVNFAYGLGLDIHIRTKLVRHWSYIKKAVIRIGNDILETEGQGKEVLVDKEVHYWVNYEYQAELTEFAGFPVTIKADGSKLQKNRFEIDLSSKYPGQKIILSTFKEFVKVDFTNPTAKAFGNTVGMLGDFHTGKTLARDGATAWMTLPILDASDD